VDLGDKLGSLFVGDAQDLRGSDESKQIIDLQQYFP
jgi:hypothetical protein